MAKPAPKRAASPERQPDSSDPAARKPRARALRRQATDAERLLWSCLRGRRLMGRKFRRQVAVGPYIVDFMSVEDSLIIEADGGQHMDHARYDARRTAFLASRGYRVLRFWNNEILTELDNVLEAILQVLGEQDGTKPNG
ncbi:MAG: endonuclease domain-containing protein [Gammaproteobacteria bacterium]|nr:endonuclease domain-containing protein [Gammaproteobacteria bacterium]